MIKFRTTTGMEKNFEKGNFNGGKVYGYNTENKELKLNEKEAKVVRYIFDKYAIDQWGYRKIASNLNDQDIKTKNRKDWTVTAVKTILNNKIYIGEIKWRGSYRKGKHTRIIDDNLWQQTQKILQIKSYLPEKTHPGSYPLSGLIKCPECGSSMVQGNSSPKYKYYQCSKNKNSGKASCSSNLIKKEYAENYVFNFLFKTFRTINLKTPVYNSTLATLSSEVEPIEDKVKEMRKELQRLSNRKNNVITWASDGTLNKATFKEQISSIQEEEVELKGFLSTLEKQIEQRKKPNMEKQIEIAIDNIENVFNILSGEDKKAILHAFIDNIYVNQGKNTKERTIKRIELKFDLNHISNMIQTA